MGLTNRYPLLLPCFSLYLAKDRNVDRTKGFVLCPGIDALSNSEDEGVQLPLPIRS